MCFSRPQLLSKSLKRKRLPTCWPWSHVPGRRRGRPETGMTHRRAPPVSQDKEARGGRPPSSPSRRCLAGNAVQSVPDLAFCHSTASGNDPAHTRAPHTCVSGSDPAHLCEPVGRPLHTRVSPELLLTFPSSPSLPRIVRGPFPVSLFPDFPLTLSRLGLSRTYCWDVWIFKSLCLRACRHSSDLSVPGSYQIRTSEHLWVDTRAARTV